jgi:predicted amidophosphoribosyltransferase
LNENAVERCPNCGKQVSKNDCFCSMCGKALIRDQNQEMDVLSFGPWGVSVCFSRPGTFVWSQQNNTKSL